MIADDALIAAARRGDPDAWRELYRAHAGRLLVWLGARTGQDCAVGPEDVAAETWLTAARRIASFSGGSQDFGAWLFGIARHIAANTRRKADRRSTDPVPDAAELPGVSTGDHAVMIEEVDWVRGVLARLPRRERDVLACVDVVGLGIEETAQALGMSPVGVRVARHRGLRRLRGLTVEDPPSAAAAVSA